MSKPQSVFFSAHVSENSYLLVSRGAGRYGGNSALCDTLGISWVLRYPVIPNLEEEKRYG